MYYFSIPDSSKTRVGNMAMLHLMREHPEWFYDDFKIDVAYGCPPSCIWNGGRAENGDRYSQLEFASVINFFKNHGVKYRLNFTNQCLEEKHLSDEYGNAIAEVVNDFGGEVAATMSLMADYMKNRYHNLDVVWSTSTNYGQSIDERIEKINCLSKNYKVVLPYNFNNTDNLDKFAYPQNIEILVCDGCHDNCELRNQHQLLVSQSIIQGKFDENLNYCQRNADGNVKTLLEQDTSYFRSSVGRNKLQWYVDKGINKFKISGREAIEKALASYMHYFVKREYKKDFFDGVDSVIKNIWGSVGRIDPDVYYGCMFNQQVCDALLAFLDKCTATTD